MSSDRVKKIPPNEIPLDVPLAGNLYIFLPKNSRRLRIREAGQYLEKIILDNYIKKGFSNFEFEPVVAPVSLENTDPSVARHGAPTASQLNVSGETLPNAASPGSATDAFDKLIASNSEANNEPNSDPLKREKMQKTLADARKKSSASFSPEEEQRLSPDSATDAFDKLIASNSEANNEPNSDPLKREKMQKTLADARKKSSTNPSQEEEEQQLSPDSATDAFDKLIASNSEANNEANSDPLLREKMQKVLADARKKSTVSPSPEEGGIFTSDEVESLKSNILKAQKNVGKLATKLFSNKKSNLSNEDIRSIIESPHYKNEAKKIMLSQFLANALERASKSGSRDDQSKYKNDLMKILSSDNISEEILNRYEVALVEENADPLSIADLSKNEVSIMEISKVLLKKYSKFTEQLEETISDIEANSQEQAKSFSFDSLIPAEDRNNLLSSDSIESLKEILTTAESNNDNKEATNIKAALLYEVKKLEAKKIINDNIKILQNEIKKALDDNSVAAEDKNESVIVLTNKLHSLELDLVKINDDIPPEQLRSWNTDLAEKLESARFSTSTTTDEIFKFSQDMQKNIVNDVTIIKNLESENKRKIDDLNIKGDTAAEMTSYIAVLSLAVGYTNRKFINEVMVAGLLHQNNQIRNEKKIPQYTQTLLNVINKLDANTSADVSVSDAEQILNITNRYMKYPGYTSGRLKIDRKLFSDLCHDLMDSEEFDAVFLERIMQYVQRGTTNDTILYCKELSSDANNILQNIVTRNPRAAQA